jgi:hypothetical protein
MTSSKSGPLDPGTPTISIDYNLYYCVAGGDAGKWAWYPASHTGFAGYVKSTGNDQHSRFADPLFVDPTKSDFHLRSGSPAVSAGTNAGLRLVGEQDLDGKARVHDSNIDAGCYEKR